MQDEVLFTEDNGVCVITLNRPDRLNALTYSMVQKINKSLNSWEINDNINCIIIAVSYTHLTLPTKRIV